MELDTAHCYPALLARDGRYDGHWYVAVSSTGIYCRPICRVRAPKPENCSFYASAAQAEALGYRPCLKCRPELAPARQTDWRWSTMDASRTLARQAAARIDQGGVESVAALAQALGISARHLLRIFAAEHGVSPSQYLQTRRLLLAKQLLCESRLTIQAIAEAAGFGSLSRFNSVFKTRYRLQPSRLRKGDGPADATHCGEPALRLGYRVPYAREAMLAFLEARAIPGIEHVDRERCSIERSLRLVHRGRELAGRIVLRFDARRPELLLSPCSSLWGASEQLLPMVRRWLDLDADPAPVDQLMAGLPAYEPGLRLPGCAERFELAMRAILGQQVTVAAARTLASRLVQRFGEPLPEAQRSEQVQLLFPRPETLARAPLEAIAELGIIRQRAQALQSLAQRWPVLAFADGSGTLEAAQQQLCEIPGLGPWTAQYMLMRGWSWPDLFLRGDVVLRNQLSPASGPPLTEAALQAAASRFAPYRSYAVLQLWRQASLAAAASARQRPIRRPKDSL